MAEYSKQNFVNGQVLTAECLNRMEEGIKAACDAAPPECDSKDCSKVLSYGASGYEWVKTDAINSGALAAIANMTEATQKPYISTYEKGSINESGDSTYRIGSRARSVGIHTADVDKTLYAANGVEGICAYFFDDDGNKLSVTNWCATLKIPAGSHYRLILSLDPKAASTVVHELSDILANFYFVNEYKIVKQVEANSMILFANFESLPDDHSSLKCTTHTAQQLRDALTQESKALVARVELVASENSTDMVYTLNGFCQRDYQGYIKINIGDCLGDYGWNHIVNYEGHYEDNDPNNKTIGNELWIEY